MKQIFCIVILSLQILLTVTQTDLYKLVLVSQERGAACLDGSPPGYYVHEGFAQNKHNYLIYFLGDGFCGESSLSDTLQSCYKNSFTQKGSSKYHSQTFNSTGLGIISTLERQNWLFFDWTKFVVIYCDGSAYVGYRQNPIQYRNQKLFFRGSRNVKQVFNHLSQHYDIYNGDTIVLTGTSDGGIASFQWSNYLYDNTKSAKVYAFPDSGFFVTDFYSAIAGKKLLRQKMEPLLNAVMNIEQFPQTIVKCMSKLGFDVVDCFNAANYGQQLKAPIFMIQSPYDQWAIRNIVGAQCLTNQKPPFSLINCNDSTRKIVEQYRERSIFYFKSIKSDRNDVGIWAPSCVQHEFSTNNAYNNSKYEVQGNPLMQTLEKFLINPKSAQWLLDEFTWPGNKGCNGLNEQKKVQQKQRKMSNEMIYE